jgi:pyruvate/2-oxoglutarate dehydrogenase complex dihydrolipoamide dehydrogenase (E3) component
VLRRFGADTITTQYKLAIIAMPLKIIVVGAGIAGLCAGLALRQAGHEVEVSLN